MKSVPLWQRLVGALLYLLPLSEAISFGSGLFDLLPQVGLLLTLLTLPITLPLGLLDRLTSFNLGFGLLPVGQIALFVFLFVKVIRNPQAPYPIRFNLLQVIILDLLLAVLGQVFAVLIEPLAPSLPFLVSTLKNTVFLLAVVLVLYGVVQSLRGKETDIPTLSDAVRMQLY